MSHSMDCNERIENINCLESDSLKMNATAKKPNQTQNNNCILASFVYIKLKCSAIAEH